VYLSVFYIIIILRGFTKTPMLESHIVDKEGFQSFLDDFVSFKRLIDPKEMADFIYYASKTPILNGFLFF
jgi:hypothetical protein